MPLPPGHPMPHTTWLCPGFLLTQNKLFSGTASTHPSYLTLRSDFLFATIELQNPPWAHEQPPQSSGALRAHSTHSLPRRCHFPTPTPHLVVFHTSCSPTVPIAPDRNQLWSQLTLFGCNCSEKKGGREEDFQCFYKIKIFYKWPFINLEKVFLTAISYEHHVFLLQLSSGTWPPVQCDTGAGVSILGI